MPSDQNARKSILNEDLMKKALDKQIEIEPIQKVYRNRDSLNFTIFPVKNGQEKFPLKLILLFLLFIVATGVYYTNDPDRFLSLLPKTLRERAMTLIINQEPLAKIYYKQRRPSNIETGDPINSAPIKSPPKKYIFIKGKYYERRADHIYLIDGRKEYHEGD